MKIGIDCHRRLRWALCLALAPACAKPLGLGTGGGALTLGAAHQGQYHLGPVEFAGAIPNACAPYPAAVSTAAGDLLAGVSFAYGGDGALCDACIAITTAKGKKLIARLVTYGVEKDDGDIDVSPHAFDLLNLGEYPRTMTWQLTDCPDTGHIVYQFQDEANEWWTSLWVRNARLPIETVEVKSAKHADFTPLTRGSDGTLTDAKGFGAGGFTLRVTAITGAQITDTFSGFTPGGVVESTGQF